LKKGELLEVINFILKNNMHRGSEKGFFPAITFLSYFTLIAENKEFESAENFLKQHTKELNPEIRKDLVKLCEATLNFEMKNFDKAHDCLKNIESQIFTDKFNIRILQLKIFFEKGYIEEALFGLAAYQHFLSQNKNVSEAYRIPNQGFTKYLRQLLRLKMKDDSIEPEILKNEIIKEKNITSKRWLLEKISS
ncbi:MAG TPA: hypothetical protein VGK25_02495, partial [Ignavibacteria bacterium]